MPRINLLDCLCDVPTKYASANLNSDTRKGMKRIFVFLSFVVLIFFVWQIWKDYNRPYLAYQKEFRNLLIRGGGGEPEVLDFKYGVRQRWISELHRVDRCETCHLGVEDPRFHNAPQPFRTHPDPDRHNFEKFGCTVCHGGQGLATSVEDAHGPTHNWNRAIYHENFVQTSCSLCHGEFITNAAPVLSQGRKMFFELGCRGCHKVQGKERIKVGPPLKKIGQKVRRDWLYRWLLDPKAYLPATRMPNFKLSRKEAADIALFLIPQAVPDNTEVIGSYDRGKQILSESRCVTCHPFEGKGGNIGPDLAKVASKIHPDWLYKWIKNPHEILPDTRMPDYGFSDQEARDVAVFLVKEYVDLELEAKEVVQERQLVQDANVRRGKELIEKYGCSGCHKIEGVEDKGETGLDLTSIGDIHISRLDFGDIHVAPRDRTVPNWLYNKMRTPRLFKANLKMPDYRFGDTEAETLTTYLLSLTSEKVALSYSLPMGKPPSEYNPQGDFGKVLDKYRCLVCHKINGRGGELAPDLSQEGSRVRKEWLQKFVKSPSAIRPILVERMPLFKIQDPEIEILYNYFRTTLVDDRVEAITGRLDRELLKNPKNIQKGRELFYSRYACNACHQINLKGGTIGPDLTHAGERLRTEWIVQYLRNPKTFLERSIEPVYNLTEKEIEALTAFLINPKEH